MQASANTGSMPATTYIGIGQIKSLGAKLDLPETGGGCGTVGSEGKASCGSSDGPEDMPQAIWDKVKDHPCYSEEAHHHFARMHVAVA
ncbi:MAG: nitrogenase cofactor biosynthesis protein NifB, partial [Rhodoferax sp.]|nr:nitrogenase cofactor biosynthesis protein NifB [Rhodoferax sp.]